MVFSQPLSYQDWAPEAGRPPNLNPAIFRNIVRQSDAVAVDPPILDIRYSPDLGGMSALSGNPTMSAQCYFRQAGVSVFKDQRTGGGEAWTGHLAAWQTHISGDAGSFDVDPQLDANFEPQNPVCVGRGYRGEAPTWTITATANPALGGTVTCAPNPVAHGGSSTCTATSNPGYAFLRWSGDCEGTAGPTCTLNHITSAKTVTANLIDLNLALPHRGGWRAILGR